jgi:uridine kinase
VSLELGNVVRIGAAEGAVALDGGVGREHGADEAPRLLRIRVAGGDALEVPPGTLVGSLAPAAEQLDATALVALVNGRYADLAMPLDEDGEVSFLTLLSRAGSRAYRRGLGFLLSIAAAGVYPGARVLLEHSLGGCVYGKLEGVGAVGGHVVDRIREEMRRLVESDLPIERVEVTSEEARRIFSDVKDGAKLKLLADWQHPTVTLHRCAGLYELFPSPTVARTGVLRRFELQAYPPGFILRLPDPGRPDGLGVTGNRPNLFRIFYEYERWSAVLGAETAGDLNEALALRRWDTLVWVAEALHEKKIAAIADRIVERLPLPRLVLIAGPSSSGKSTFSRRLAIQLRVLGMDPETVSVDDYFVSRDLTPRDSAGEYNFEALAAIDIELFNKHLMQLLDGRTVVLPRFDFGTGRRTEGRSLRLEPGRPLIVEGIHGLNDALTPTIWSHLKYKIYVSALTYLNVDDQNAISTSDVRLLRRIVRDCHSRGYSAADTLKRWPSVRAGEEQYIFPYQESADTMFNSAMVYELNALKAPASQALRTVPRDCPAHAEAQRLLDLLDLFRPAPTEHVPATSILREFIGGSAFREVR